MSLSLNEYFEAIKKLENKILNRITPPGPNVSWSSVCSSFGTNNQCFGVAAIFLEQDLKKARQHFYLCGRFLETAVGKYNSRVLDYGIAHFCYALLSDNRELLGRLANVAYKGDGKNYPDMEVMVEEGEIAIFCHTIQMIIKDDWDTVARNLGIMEKITLPQSDKVMGLDFEYFQAMLNKDKAAVEDVLRKFLTPENHKARNDDPIFSQYISMPALGYAKLAWIKGLEVEVNNPMVPKELLPVRPLEKYDDTYAFWSLMT